MSQTPSTAKSCLACIASVTCPSKVNEAPAFWLLMCRAMCITSAEDVGLPGEHVCKSDPWELHSDRLHSMTEWALFLFCCTWSCACILTYSDDNQCSCAATWWVPQESCLQLIGCKAQQCSCAYQTALLASICT